MKQTNSGNTETSTQQSIKTLRDHLLFCFRQLKYDDPETVIQANLGFSIDGLEEMARERASFSSYGVALFQPFSAG